mmetsp:Transcript_24139/g.57258  ORF Transcript_24139/g.57258 Transcript_24139/m.57258 type:complete len:145 (-) Transcript_24139:28-462(-)
MTLRRLALGNSWRLLARHTLQSRVRTFSASTDPLVLTPRCVQKIKQLRAKNGNEELKLRIGVDGGGCSGMQYTFDLGTKVEEDDRVFESDGAEVVTDNVSFQFLHGATLDYVEELISSSFRVVSNPNSEGSCGCGTSFTPAPPP